MFSPVTLRLLIVYKAQRMLGGQKRPGQSWGREYPSFKETDLLYEHPHRTVPAPSVTTKSNFTKPPRIPVAQVFCNRRTN
jgi:hypothetical protein